MKRILSFVLAACMAFGTIGAAAEETAAAAAETEAAVGSEAKNVDASGYYRKEVTFDDLRSWNQLQDLDPGRPGNYAYSDEFDYYSDGTGGSGARLSTDRDHTTGSGKSLFIYNKFSESKGTYVTGRLKLFNMFKDSPLTEDDIGKSYKISFWLWSDKDDAISAGVMSVADHPKYMNTSSTYYGSYFYNNGALNYSSAMTTFKIPAKKWTKCEFTYTMDATNVNPIYQIGMLTFLFQSGGQDYGSMLWMDDIVVSDANAPMQNTISPIDTSYTVDKDVQTYGDLADTKKLLTKLGMFKQLFGKYEADKKMSREDFAYYISQFMGETAQSAEAVPSFSDAAYSNYPNAIAAVAAMGIMGGDGNGLFRPTDYITYSEAVAAMIKFLGYSVIAEDRGGFPAGYINQANATGLTEGINVNNNEELTYLTFLKLIKNFIVTDTLEQTGYGENKTYKEREGNTVLAQYKNIYHGKGVVTANSKSSVESDSNVGSGKIRIDNMLFDDDNSGAESLLGYNSEYWYDMSKSTAKLVYAHESDLNKITGIDAENIVGLQGNSLKYWSSDTRTTEKSLNGTEAYIVNGIYTAPNADIFDLKEGSVTFIDNDSDGAAEIIAIDKIEYYTVASVDVTSGTIYDKFGKAPLVLGDGSDKNIGYSLVNASGDAIQLSNLSEWTILAVRGAKSGTAAIYDVVASDYTAIGKLSGTTKDKMGHLCFRMDDKVIQTTDTFRTYIDNGTLTEVPMDTYVTLYLNREGKVVAWNHSSTRSVQIGYLMDLNFKTGFDATAELKILTSDSQIEIFDLADRLNLNGDTVKPGANRKELQNTIAGGQVICYTLNSSNKINRIDTERKIQLSDNDNYLVKNLDTSCYYISSGNYFHTSDGASGKMYNIKSDTVTFKIPESEKYLNENKYYSAYLGSALASSAPGGDTFNVIGYTFGRESNFIDVAVIKNDNPTLGAAKSSTETLIKSVATVLTEEGDSVLECIGISNGKEVTFRVDDKRSVKSPGLTEGDVICYIKLMNENDVLTLDDNATAISWYADYDPKTKTVKGENTIHGNYGSRKGALMYPYSTNNGYISFNSAAMPDSDDTTAAYLATETRFTVFERERGIVREGTAGDVNYYSSTQNLEETTPVYMRVSGGKLVDLIVYR